jgi:hypothetical protein
MDDPKEIKYSKPFMEWLVREKEKHLTPEQMALIRAVAPEQFRDEGE